MKGKGKRGNDMEKPGSRSRPARRGKGSTARRRERRVGGSRAVKCRPCSGKRGAAEARKGSETGARDGQWNRA